MDAHCAKQHHGGSLSEKFCNPKIELVTIRLMSNFAWLPLAFLSAIFAALVAIFGKIAVTSVDPNIATLVRAAIMTVFLLLVGVVTGKIGSVTQIGSKDFLWILLSGLAGAISWLFYFWALKLGPATKVATIDRLSLVMVAVFAAIFLGEKFSWFSALGILLVASGAYLITLK